MSKFYEYVKAPNIDKGNERYYLNALIENGVLKEASESKAIQLKHERYFIFAEWYHTWQSIHEEKGWMPTVHSIQEAFQYWKENVEGKK